MLSTKVRTIIIGSLATVALAVPGVASAAVLVRSPATITPTVPRVASAAVLVRSPATITPTTVKPITTTAAKEAGGAGVPGYDDERCQELAGESSYYENKLEDDIQTAGKTPMGTPEHQQAVDAAHYDTDVAYQDNQELSDNCLVVD